MRPRAVLWPGGLARAAGARAPVAREALWPAAVGLAALGLVVTGGFAHAQAPPAARGAPLGLREAVERALEHHPSLGAARAEAEAARAGHGQAKAAWWPEVGLSGSLTRYQEPMVVSPIHAFTPGETPAFDETLIRGGGHLRWTVYDGGGRESRVRRARWRASAAEAGVDAETQALVADVAAAYLEALTGTEVLTAHDRRIDALEGELGRVLQLLEVGRAAEIEVLRVEAALASARAERIEVASGLEVARRELARLAGVPPDEPEVRGLSPVRLRATTLPAREEFLARAVTASPTVERARRLRTASAAGLSLARSERWPDVELFGDWIDHAGIDSDHNLEWSGGLRLALPVFTGGRLAEGEARARAEAEAAEQRLRLAVLATEEAVDRAVSAIEEAEARVESLEIAAARSREVARIERLRLETGTGTQTDYLDAEAELLSAEAAVAEALHASIRARVELARIAGRLGLGWIEENLEGEG